MAEFCRHINMCICKLCLIAWIDEGLESPRITRHVRSLCNFNFWEMVGGGIECIYLTSFSRFRPALCGRIAVDTSMVIVYWQQIDNLRVVLRKNSRHHRCSAHLSYKLRWDFLTSCWWRLPVRLSVKLAFFLLWLHLQNHLATFNQTWCNAFLNKDKNKGYRSVCKGKL